MLASGERGFVMGEIVNLRLARKARARRAAAAAADVNRAAFGRTKAERARDVADRAKVERVLDQARRDGEKS
jgi:hypothetical protein